MRRAILAVLVLGAAAALLWLGVRRQTAQVAEASRAPRASPAPGTTLQTEAPADLDVRGSTEQGSTPRLAEAPAAGDGVLEVEVLAGARPVAGASVRLYWRGARDPNLGEVTWRLASAGTTDATGRVQLPSRPGAYRLSARGAGLAPAQREVVRPYGEARTRLRVGLEPGAALAGRTVVKGSGEPLAQVELVLTAHGRPLEAWEQAQAPAEERVYASSDARGRFALAGLAPGDYALEARAPGHARLVQRRVQVPATGELVLALPLASVLEGYVVDAEGRGVADAQVQVSGREPQMTTTGEGGGFSVEVEAGLLQVSARKGALAGALPRALVVAAGATVRDVRLQLAAGGVLEGKVVAKAGGAPVAGASVDVSPAGLNGDSGRARTGPDGTFRVEGLAPGGYDVAVSAPGFSSGQRRGLMLAAGERFTLELALAGTGSVEGTVSDAAGSPLGGVRVVGGSRWGAALGSVPAEAVTDGAGRYRLTGLEAEDAYLTATREGATLGASQLVRVQEGETARADFTLADVGYVEGRVRTPQGGVPLPPLGVRAFPEGRVRLQGADIARARVQEGRFRLALPAGGYGLRLAEEGASSGSFRTESVKVEAGRTVQVELTHAPEENLLRGVVLEPGGVPSSGAQLRVAAEDGSLRLFLATDEEGRFALPVRVGKEGQGPLTLAASNGGRSGTLKGVRPDAGEVLLQLRPGGSVRGRVVRSTGAPVRGFRIRLATSGDLREFPGERFELPDVPGERFTLVATTEDRFLGSAPVELTPGASAEVTVTVRPTGSLSGRIVDEAGRPIADAQVSLGGTGYNETVADGRFTIEWVRAGEHTVRVLTQDRRTLEHRVTVAEGQTLSLGDLAVGAAPPPKGLAQEQR